MPRKYKRTLGSRPYANYSSETLEECLRAIRSKEITQRAAEEKYGIPRATIKNKLAGKHSKPKGGTTTFTVEEERVFEEHLVRLSDFGFPSQRSIEDYTENYLRAVEDAQDLIEAGNKQPPCVESVFLSILCSRSFPQLAQVVTEYKRETGKDLEETIREEFSGDMQAGLLAIVKSAKNKAVFFAEQLRSTFEGANAKDGNLIRIVVTRSEIDMRTIKKAFVYKYEKSIEECIKDLKCCGDYKRCLLSLIE